ncbi:MAG TPA: SRPBCC family protein [Armatimonadota bacterium]|nr:SRPBCC family protein [Armatimonadota bacterium]
MARHTKSIEIEAPVREVFEQWRRYEGFDRILPQLREVRATGERCSHWVIDLDGATVEWDAEITALEPGRLIAWKSVSGLENSGEAQFRDLGGGRTCVDVTLDYELPLDADEGLFGIGGKVEEELEAGLEGVKELAEARA